MDSQEFDYKIETQHLQSFKATETSYKMYSDHIYYFCSTVTTILVYYLLFRG